MPLTVLNVGYPFACVSPKTAGGAEQILAALDKALVHAGHRSIVLAPEGSHSHGLLLPTPSADSSLDAKVQQTIRAELRKALQRALERFNVDVVHLHGVDFLEYLPITNIPLVVTLHLPLSWYPDAIFHLKRSNTWLACVSNSQARTRPPETHIDAVIENGVVEEASALHNFRSLKRAGKYVLSMGRICPEKGFHHALDAATEAGMTMLLAGKVFAYPDHEKYFREEIQARLRGHRFIGAVGGERKRDLLAGARCVLIPSRVNETSSLVAMEALACGTPVVAFRSGALSEIISHGRTGFLVESVSEMASAIAATASLDPVACRDEAEQRFPKSKMIQAYLDLYQIIAAGRAIPSGLSFESSLTDFNTNDESQISEIHEVLH
ncbi:MAG: glycosyltransferase [Terriglobales bacterium]